MNCVLKKLIINSIFDLFQVGYDPHPHIKGEV